MTISCIRKIAAIAVFSILSALSTASMADTIEPADTIKALIGKTWAGKNKQGHSFWFWHEQGPRSGAFVAKFNNPAKGISVHHGTWEIDGDEICWDWPDWKKKYCYIKFEISGGTLEMTRADGEVHSGVLVEGNTEDL